MVDSSNKYYHEVDLSNLTTDEIRALYPPGTIVTQTHEDFPFGETVDGLGVYVDPRSNVIHVKGVNGDQKAEADWKFTLVYVADH